MQTEVDRRTANPAAELLSVVAGFRRSLRRHAEPSGLSPAELELLRLVADRPGIRIGEAAQALRLASNSVSTLIGKLERRGSVERRPASSDGRGVTLHLTAEGEARRRRRRDRREVLVTAALGNLSLEERQALTGALPALRRIVDELETAKP